MARSLLSCSLAVGRAFAAVAGLGACGGAPATGLGSPEPPSPPPAATALPDEGWARVELADLGLVLALPDRGGWSVTDGSPGRIALEHRGSQSLLRIRTWPEVRSVTPEACTERVRLVWPELAAVEGGELVDDRPLSAPAGYRGWLRVAIAVGADGGVDGYLFAVGASLGRCLAVAFVTHARGPGANQAVGESLAVLGAGSLDTLEARRVADRAEWSHDRD